MLSQQRAIRVTKSQLQQQRLRKLLRLKKSSLRSKRLQKLQLSVMVQIAIRSVLQLLVLLLVHLVVLHAVPVLLVSSVLKMDQLISAAVVRNLRVKQRVLHKHKQITSTPLLSLLLRLFMKLNYQKQLQRAILPLRWQLRLAM